MSEETAQATVTTEPVTTEPVTTELVAKDPVATQATRPEPLFGRALSALLAAATMVAAAFGGASVGLAGSGQPAHAQAVHLLAQAAHDIGHNEWAFQGESGKVGWIAGYCALCCFWLGAALWMCVVGRRRGRRTPWRRVLIAAWSAEFAAAALCLAAAYLAEHTSTAAGPVLLRLADLCSPWWAGPAALAALVTVERSRALIQAAAGYGAVLALFLEVSLPGPATLRILILAAAAGFPALVGPVYWRSNRPGRIPLSSDAGSTG